MSTVHGLPLDAIQQIRHPSEVFTDAYLNDPIKFDPDDRFDPESAIRQETEIPVVERDFGLYVTVNLNAKEPANLPVSMFTKVIDRDDYIRLIDRDFRFFPVV